MLNLQYNTKTDIGKKRQQNQDSVFANPEISLFVVADGMGGHLGGGTASSMAVETINQEIIRALGSSDGGGVEGGEFNPALALEGAIQQANQTIFERAAQEATLKGMGTTVTALFFHNRVLYIGHVGDSRCYFFQGKDSWQITRDHSLVQEKLKAGLITREQLRTDHMKNVITRSVGFEPIVAVDIYQMEIQAQDLFLICSDGLSGMVDPKDISRVLTKELDGGHSLEQINGRLVEISNDRGGEDNITSVLIQVVAI